MTLFWGKRRDGLDPETYEAVMSAENDALEALAHGREAMALDSLPAYPDLCPEAFELARSIQQSMDRNAIAAYEKTMGIARSVQRSTVIDAPSEAKVAQDAVRRATRTETTTIRVTYRRR